MTTAMLHPLSRKYQLCYRPWNELSSPREITLLLIIASINMPPQIHSQQVTHTRKLVIFVTFSYLPSDSEWILWKKSKTTKVLLS